MDWDVAVDEVPVDEVPVDEVIAAAYRLSWPAPEARAPEKEAVRTRLSRIFRPCLGGEEFGGWVVALSVPG